MPAMLAGLLGASIEEFERRVDRRNLLPEWPGRAGSKGDVFPMALAAGKAAAMASSLLGARSVLLGRGVAAAFGLVAPFLEWRRVGGNLFACLPHPSGINLWWNDPANRDAARAFMEDAWRLTKGAGRATRGTRPAGGTSTAR